MGTKHYVALVRGINVGGRNKVAMADLRAAFDDHRSIRSVRTYIQTGNVLLESDAAAEPLEGEIEGLLERRFGVPLVVVVRSHQQLRGIVDRAPEVFRAEPGTHHCDTVFLKPPLTGREAMHLVELRDGVDQAWPGAGVLYFARLSAERSKSRMSRIVARPEYQRMTIRSWSTTTKLLAMLDAHTSSGTADGGK